MAVHLKLPEESPPELILGELSSCTVVVLNDDPFPEAHMHMHVHSMPYTQGHMGAHAHMRALRLLHTHSCVHLRSCAHPWEARLHASASTCTRARAHMCACIQGFAILPGANGRYAFMDQLRGLCMACKYDTVHC